MVEEKKVGEEKVEEEKDEVAKTIVLKVGAKTVAGKLATAIQAENKKGTLVKVRFIGANSAWTALKALAMSGVTDKIAFDKIKIEDDKKLTAVSIQVG